MKKDSRGIVFANIAIFLLIFSMFPLATGSNIPAIQHDIQVEEKQLLNSENFVDNLAHQLESPYFQIRSL